jgi:Zn2+/Cd2+-exporting ATPase
MDAQVLHLPVTSSCGLCAQRMVDLVGILRGVEEASYSETDNVLHLRYFPELISVDTVQAAFRDFGIEVTNRWGHDTLTLLDLDCPDCATKIEKSVKQLRGVNWAHVNYAAGKILYEYSVGQVDRKSVVERIARVGYQVERRDRPRATKREWLRRYRATLLTGAAGTILAASYLLAFLKLLPEYWSGILFLVSLAVSGWPVARSGYFALRTWTLDISVLVTVAGLGAIYLGHWGEAAMVMFLFSLGETLEAMTMNRTRRAIQALIEIAPKDALVRRQGREERVLVEDLQVSDLIVIKPGEQIPMDGQIEKGMSDIDQSPITGESNPVCREPGQKVFAGTINLSGSLEVQVTRLSKDTTLSRILQLVKEAQAKKAPSERLAETFGRYYTPAVVGAAILIAVLGPLVLGKPFHDMLYLALTLLVVSCPCALVISTPVAIVSAIGNAARAGVLIKGGAFLEAAGRLQALAFDKTGTLTWGKPEVKDLIPLSEGFDAIKLASVAASLEQRSEHPLAEAMVAKARELGAPLQEVDQFLAIPGRGVRGKLQDVVHYAGNLAYWQEHSRLMTPEIIARIHQLETEGKSVFLVGTDEKILGLIAMADRLRESAPQAMAELRRRGIKKLILLTGDNPTTAEAIAREAGVDEFRAGLLPQEKVRVVHRLLDQYKTVGMVGDGINDAPALAASSVGIAMGSAGTDVALETADIALMGDDLSRLATTISLSRKAVRVIRQNLVISFLAIGLLISFTFLGILNLTLAILGHEGSALLVIFNGMRLFPSRRWLRPAAPRPQTHNHPEPHPPHDHAHSDPDHHH